MRKITWLAALLVIPNAWSVDRSLDARATQEAAKLLPFYETMHSGPELSHHEKETSARVAEELRAAGYDVTDHVGKYPDPRLTGYGVVAVLRNGSGPTVLVRADMDALPVEEQTNASYASHVRAIDDSGTEVPVMHACGHDIHTTVLIGTARMLVSSRGQWQGTLVLIVQPAEEKGDGARAMLADGLYTRFPKPDFAVALHDFSDLEAGTVGYISGYMLAGATSVDVTIRGRGGHGAYPQFARDSIVMAAQFVTAIQTIVSRENVPTDPAVVTVGSIHGGTKYNIIPDEVKLQLTIRTYEPEVRQRILDALSRIANGIAQAGGMPPDRMPVVKVNETEKTTPIYNDPKLTGRVAASLQKALGRDKVLPLEPMMGSEDFGAYGLDGMQIPSVLFRLGAIDAQRIANSKATNTPLPALHSSLFLPAPESTLRTGMIAMTSVVTDLMRR